MKESKYKPITKEQKDAIKALFDNSSWETVEYEFETRDNGYYITASKMYEYVGFKDVSTLQGYLKLAEILGCENGDEVDRHFYSGCETCDFGSSYTIKLRLW
jgi:hypothetical protein